MRARGGRSGTLSISTIRLVTYGNALSAYGRNGQMQEADWLDPAPIDQRTLYMGNSVLRGGQAPRVEELHRRGPGDLVIE